MSQRSEKLRRRVDTLEARIDAVELGKVWDAAEAAVHNQAALGAAAERNAERRRAREAERAVVAWRRMTYAILVAAIIVLVAAILVVNAKAEDTPRNEFKISTIETTPKTILGTTEVIKQADMPSKTYHIDFQTGRISGTVDGREAMVQAIRKILQTERFQYLIYSWNYGMEWSQLIGKSRETALANLKQQLESALLQDDRILSITDLNVTDSGRRFLTVSFTANTIFGAVGAEITANV